MRLPPAAELDATIFFGRNGLADKYLLQNWAQPEESHHWNDGIEPSLALFLATPPATRLFFSVEIRPHLGAGLPRQDVTLYFNGLRLGFWRLERLDGFRLTAEIEPEHWLPREGGAWAKCTWHLPYSTAPSALAKTQDHRLLGLCFQSLALTLAPPRPRS
jgi:hypothetical protein